MEENRKILPFTDDEGNTVELELVDSFELEDKQYAVLVEPEIEDSDEDEGLVYIMEIQSDSDDEMILVKIEDESIMDKAFDMFKQRCEEDFDFVD